MDSTDRFCRSIVFAVVIYAGQKFDLHKCVDGLSMSFMLDFSSGLARNRPTLFSLLVPQSATGNDSPL